MRKIVVLLALLLCVYVAKAQQKISQMATVTTVSATDYIPIIQSSVNKKVTAMVLSEYILENAEKQFKTYDYIVDKIDSVYYATAKPNTSYTSYSGSVASTVINSAISQLTSGGNIYIKAGTYNITTRILIENKSNLKIEGEGWNKTLFTSVGESATVHQLIHFRGVCDKVEITGIGIASTATDATERKALIYMGDYAPGSVDPQFSNININNCSFTCANLNSNALSMDLGLDSAYLYDFKFNNNYIYNVGRCGIEVIDHYSGSRTVNNISRIEISGNYLTNTGVNNSWGMGISFSVNHAGVYATDLTISNNTCYELGKNQAIEVRQFDGVNITNNNITNVTKLNVTGITNYDCKNVNIQGNNIDLADPDSPGNKATSPLPLTLNLSSKSTVTGNTFKGGELSLTDCTYITIVGNNISTIGYYIIKFFDTTTYCKIANNIFDCSRADWVPSAVIYVSHAGTAYNEITDNLLIGASANVTDFTNGGTSLNNIYEKKEAYAIPSEIGTTMKLSPGNQFILVTSGNLDRMVLLPEACTNLIGIKIRGKVGVNGFELRVATSQATTVYLNNVTTNVEAAIPANTLFEAELVDATHWVLKAWTLLGEPITAIVPDAN